MSPNYKSFADFPTEGFLEGEKVPVNEIIGKPILIMLFIVMPGKLRTEFVTKIQFQYLPDENAPKYYCYTGSGVVREQLQRLQNELPLWGKLTQHQTGNGLGRYLCIE